jgi:hypothetical protein
VSVWNMRVKLRAKVAKEHETTKTTGKEKLLTVS